MVTSLSPLAMAWGGSVVAGSGRKFKALFDPFNADTELQDIILTVSIRVLKRCNALLHNLLPFFNAACRAFQRCHIFIKGVEAPVDGVETLVDGTEAFNSRLLEFVEAGSQDLKIIEDFVILFITGSAHKPILGR